MVPATALAPRGQALSNYFPAILLGCVGVSITVFDAVFMAEGAAAMAHSIQAAQLLAGVAVCAAILKAGWLSAVRTFLLSGQFGLALAAFAIGLLTHVFSITATIGIAATGRDMVIADRTEAQDRHKRALAAYERARLAKAALPGTRPVAAIRADLTAVEEEIADHARREAAERASTCGARCQEAISKGGAAKDKRDGFKNELGLALEAAKADADLSAAQAALSAIPTPAAKDPQAATLAAFVPLAGFTEREAALLVTLLPSLIIEIGGPVSFLIASALFGMARHDRLPAVPRRAPQAPHAVLDCAPASRPTMKQLPAPEHRNTPYRDAPLTAQEFAAIRDALGEGQAAFAARFGVDVRTIRRYENGEREIGRKITLQARQLAEGLR